MAIIWHMSMLLSALRDESIIDIIHKAITILAFPLISGGAYMNGLNMLKL